jgi:NB-ARC domain
MRAAKSWLSSRDRPWLLIIDNADDAKLDVEDFFPDNEQGFTLITTRNPSVKIHGTVGQGSYRFDRLSEDEAGELLLKAAEQQSPWTPTIKRLASTITKALGALPLALIHAGKAIRARYCSLSNYLDYYDKSWQLIRQDRAVTGYKDDDDDMDEYSKVYASYEIVYLGFENYEFRKYKDAIQLLKLFSFYHHEHIPFGLLTGAVRHPRLGRESQNSHTEATRDEKDNKARYRLAQAAKYL